MVTSHHQPLNAELKHLEFEHAAFGTIGLEAMFGVLTPCFLWKVLFNSSVGEELFLDWTPRNLKLVSKLVSVFLLLTVLESLINQLSIPVQKIVFSGSTNTRKSLRKPTRRRFNFEMSISPTTLLDYRIRQPLVLRLILKSCSFFTAMEVTKKTSFLLRITCHKII